MIYRYIYKITCTTGSFKDKFYFGQHTTENLEDAYKGSGRKIGDYYKKHPNDYIKEIISFHNSQEELNQAEYDIIKPWLGNEMCLNIVGGGNKGEATEEYRQKMREAQIGLQAVEKHPMYGKHHTEESKQLMSKNRKGKCTRENNCNYGKLKGKDNPMYGKHHTEESKQLMSENHYNCSGKNNPMYGKHHSDASRQKMKESKRNYYKTHQGVNKGKTSPIKGKHRTVVDGHIRYI